ncbi:MAG: ABC transporter permease [bacterium]|nr:ABC transporter permease [bacterium]
MLQFQREIRYGCRVLLKNPTLSIVALLTIALGGGANIAIYSVVNSTLLRRLPYEDPERLAMVWWTSPGSATIPLSMADFHDWREQNQSFAELAAYHPWGFTLTGTGEAEHIRGAVVTSHVFDLVGITPRLGRSFDADGPGTPAAVILSAELWKRRFGRDPNILGKKLVLDGEPAEVIGIMPGGVRFPPLYPAELWQANTLGPQDVPRDMRYLRVLGRLKEGQSVASADAEAAAIARMHERQYPDINAGLGGRVVPLREMVVNDFRQAVLLLQFAVLMALAIACFNVAILQLTRASVRSGEISVRLALGAGRFQLFRQFLGENFVLALCGGALGLIAGHWGVLLLARFGPRNIYRLDEAAIDGQVLAFALAITLGSGLLFGLAPAFYSSRFNFNQLLREEGRASTGATRLRNVFVFLQVAITLILLVGAALLIRSFGNLSTVSPGFKTENLLTMEITLPVGKATVEQTSAFYGQLKEGVENLPGVKSFATSFSLPLGGRMSVNNDFDIEGRAWTPSDPKRNAQIRPVSPGFFATMGIPLITGRSFTEHDRADSRGVVVINQEMARIFWPGTDPIGQRLKATIDLGAEVGRFENDTWEVVGVVGDIKHRSLGDAIQPAVFCSTLQGSWLVMNLLVRTTVDRADLAKAVAAEVHALDSDLPVVRVRTMEQMIADSLSQPRFNTWLVSVFAVFALALTVVGLYGVLSYSVQQRTREIGLRMALGAGKKDVVWLVVRRGLSVALTGLAAGLLGSLLLVRFLAGLLFGISPRDPGIFAGISLMFVLAAFLASYLPARRAAEVDPITSLRHE